jgi:hypothetical protein
MAGAVKLIEFLLLSKLPWIGLVLFVLPLLVCMCLFVSIFARPYFKLGLWALVQILE